MAPNVSLYSSLCKRVAGAILTTTPRPRPRPERTANPFLRHASCCPGRTVARVPRRFPRHEGDGRLTAVLHRSHLHGAARRPLEPPVPQRQAGPGLSEAACRGSCGRCFQRLAAGHRASRHSASPGHAGRLRDLLGPRGLATRDAHGRRGENAAPRGDGGPDGGGVGPASLAARRCWRPGRLEGDVGGGGCRLGGCGPAVRLAAGAPTGRRGHGAGRGVRLWVPPRPRADGHDVPLARGRRQPRAAVRHAPGRRRGPRAQRAGRGAGGAGETLGVGQVQAAGRSGGHGRALWRDGRTRGQGGDGGLGVRLCHTRARAPPFSDGHPDHGIPAPYRSLELTRGLGAAAGRSSRCWRCGSSTGWRTGCRTSTPCAGCGRWTPLWHRAPPRSPRPAGWAWKSTSLPPVPVSLIPPEPRCS